MLLEERPDALSTTIADRYRIERELGADGRHVPQSDTTSRAGALSRDDHARPVTLGYHV